LILIRGLRFSFSNDESPVLGDIDLRIDEGEFVAITGPSGSGKSTLCLILCGFLPREGHMMEGTVEVLGKDVRTSSTYELTREIGIVQQDPEAQLCTLNVYDEVAFGPENLLLPEEEVIERVNWALNVVGLQDFIERDTSNLSGGEKQRLAIASILAMRPRVIVFDEPTSQLDPKGTAQIFSVIKDLQSRTGITTIVIEHKLRQILPICSRLIAMDQGKIVVDSPADQLSEHASTLKGIGVRLPFISYVSPAVRTDPSGDILSVRSLSVRFPEKDVLDEVSFTISKGEMVALMGDNGSGKSTLLSAILGLEKKRKGTILIDGRDADEMSMKERARHIGFIFQNPNHQIFESSVRREVLFACENFGFDLSESEDEMRRLLSECNLERYIDRHPYSLSYGEKRRLNLASVFIYRPNLLLMDEPFVGQDLRNLQQVMSVVNGFINKGGSSLMVIHDPEIARLYCNRLLFLSEGRLVVDAPTEEAFRRLSEMGEWEYVP